MNIKYKFLLISILLISNISFADVFNNEKNADYIFTKLPEIKSRNCKFIQDKYVPISGIHLESSGDFKFEKDKGVVFYITYPVKSTISYTNDEYKQVNYIIKAIADRDYSKLEHNFKLYFEENKGAWILGLKPIPKSKLSAYISQIEVFGKDDISKIIIKTMDETVTTLKFYN